MASRYKAVDFDLVQAAANDAIAKALKKSQDERKKQGLKVPNIAQTGSFIMRFPKLKIEPNKLFWSTFFVPGFWDFRVGGTVPGTKNKLDIGQTSITLKVEGEPHGREASGHFSTVNDVPRHFFFSVPGTWEKGGRLFLYGHHLFGGTFLTLENVWVLGDLKGDNSVEEI